MRFPRLLWHNIKKSKTLFRKWLISFIIGSVALTINPYVTSRIIGCFNIEEKSLSLNMVIFWLVIFIIFKTLQAINQYFLRILQTTLETTLNSNIVSDLFETTHAHNIRYFDDEMTGRISTAITKASKIIQGLFMQTLFLLCRPLINLIFAFGIIASSSPKLALVLAILCIPFFFIFKYMGKKIHNMWNTRGDAERQYLGFITDSLSNYKIVRYTGSVFSEKQKAFTTLKKYLRTTYDCENQRGIYEIITNMTETIFVLLGYITVLYFTFYDNLSLANTYFAITTITMLNKNLSAVNQFMRSFFEDYGELSSHLALIYKPIEIKDKPTAIPLKIKKATISYQHIRFSYIAEKPVFEDLNLVIPAGQKVGLVGLSGSGKSTLINLLMRAYLPQSGHIRINRKDINDVTEFSLHQNISYVPQDVTLFNRSLYENLKIGNIKATKKDIIEASKLAYIDETIQNLENGYDSIVGERGILLSGGERQRIAIARAILQNAPILILDEATSALDSQAEVMIQNALENLMKNKTVIAIAHRLSTLRAMDRIIVLDKGKIIEDDTPLSLLQNKNSLFKHLYDLQTSGYINATPKGEE